MDIGGFAFCIVIGAFWPSEVWDQLMYRLGRRRYPGSYSKYADFLICILIVFVVLLVAIIYAIAKFGHWFWLLAVAWAILYQGVGLWLFEQDEKSRPMYGDL